MNTDQIRILLVEDDEDDYIITKDLFSQINGVDYKLDWVARCDDALQAISHNSHDVYIFDYQLGEHTGLDLLHQAVEAGCNAPIILLTGQGDQNVDMEAMNAGAADFLHKSEITACLLERSIRYAIKHKQAEDRVLRIAFYDSLTKLPNRALFQDRLKQALKHSDRYHDNFAVLFLDLDNFKRINDTLEHRIGDLLLKKVAERLNRSMRSADTIARRESTVLKNTVARLGGDEFTLLLTMLTSMEDAAKVSQRVLSTLSQPFQLEGYEVFITGSIGIAVYPHDGDCVNSLLKNADTAMYHAKAEGKNNFQFYKHSMSATALERLNMENSLRKAIEQEELILYYQPRVSIPTGEIVGTEALIRWQHPQKGLISPGEFIPVAEETGLIIPLGEWVLKSACRQNKVWHESGAKGKPVAVSLNLSQNQFRQENLINVIEKVLDDTGLDPRYLELEITESVIMKNAARTVATLHRLKDMGVRLSMDDFGTGYSSFSYLKRFPIDNIKIDRSFVKDMTRSNADSAIVRAIIVMAHTLNLTVIAEGVETKEQLELLREMECDEMQGYLFSTPLSSQEASKLLLNKIESYLHTR